RHDAPLFPLVRTAIEGLSALAFVFLFISGLILGALCPKHPVRLGLCTMAAFPLLAFAEMVTDSTSHNLWPIEFVMYGVMSLAAVCGAYIARSARRWGSKHA
ncbi:MAG TPA: hypothetical protein VNT79_13610, partial [Phycisphaerae bacterium]|nr:hypothetical protein [Phycisphaerae bacterium]